MGGDFVHGVIYDCTKGMNEFSCSPLARQMNCRNLSLSSRGPKLFEFGTFRVEITWNILRADCLTERYGECLLVADFRTSR